MSEIDTAEIRRQCKDRELNYVDLLSVAIVICDEIDRLRHECAEFERDQHDNLIHHHHQQKEHSAQLASARAEALEEAAHVLDMMARASLEASDAEALRDAAIAIRALAAGGGEKEGDRK